MFDVGFWELTLLATLALLVLGPEKLPGLVSSVGRMMGRARSLARGLKMQIEREMNQVNPLDTKPKPKPNTSKPGGSAASDEQSKPTE